MCIRPERDNRPFHKGLGPSSTLELRLHAGCPWKDLHHCVSSPFFLLFFSSYKSTRPIHSFIFFLFPFSSSSLCFLTFLDLSVPSHPVVLKVWSGNATGILEGGFQQKGGKKTCFRYNSIHKLPRARMYRYFGFHALALIKHLKAKLSSDGGPRSYLCQFKGL